MTLMLGMVFSHVVNAENNAMLDLQNNLAAFTHIKANFSQLSQDEKGQPLQQMHGELVIAKPDRFFWRTEEPSPQQLVSDGKTIWHFDEDLEQVVVQNFNEQKQHSPLLLVLEDASVLNKRFDVQYSTDTRDFNNNSVNRDEIKLFVLTPRKGQSASIGSVKSVQLMFINKQLAAMSFIDALQQKTVLHLNDVVINEPIDAQRFQFDIPVDVDVLYE